MTGPNPNNRPTFPLAEGFTVPPMDAAAMRAVNEAFKLEQYTSAPLIDGATREQVFGKREPQGVVGNFACNGFVVHTLVPSGRNVGTEAFVAPPPDLTEEAFLRLSLILNQHARPEQGFEQRVKGLGEIAAALGRRGISVAAGFHIGVKIEDPKISFGSLFIPRLYIDEFGRDQTLDPPSMYGIKLASVLFSHLTQSYLGSSSG